MKLASRICVWQKLPNSSLISSGGWIHEDYVEELDDDEADDYLGDIEDDGPYKNGDTGYMVSWIQEALDDLGYYDGRCATGGLTSTVLRIFEDRVEIARYTYEEKDGTSSARLTNLKESGIWDKDHIFGDFTKKKNTTSVYESIQTVLLKTAPGK